MEFVKTGDPNFRQRSPLDSLSLYRQIFRVFRTRRILRCSPHLGARPRARKHHEGSRCAIEPGVIAPLGSAVSPRWSAKRHRSVVLITFSSETCAVQNEWLCWSTVGYSDVTARKAAGRVIPQPALQNSASPRTAPMAEQPSTADSVTRPAAPR